MEEAVSNFGRIDVLVNNAGTTGRSTKINDMTTNDWDEVMNINLKSAFLCTREAIKQMLRKKENNNIYNNNNNYSIINISSFHQSVPLVEGVAYTVSKGGVEMLTKTVALEMADKGIRVNGIAPGAIETDMQIEVLEDEEKKKQKENQTPVRRLGKPEEIAKVALFLASKDASCITGTTIYADGGRTLSS
jgi:glucose 1-dehydrogenase